MPDLPKTVTINPGGIAFGIAAPREERGTRARAGERKPRAAGLNFNNNPLRGQLKNLHWHESIRQLPQNAAAGVVVATFAESGHLIKLSLDYAASSI
jgi:hypothetical protein